MEMQRSRIVRTKGVEEEEEEQVEDAVLLGPAPRPFAIDEWQKASQIREPDIADSDNQGVFVRQQSRVSLMPSRRGGT